MTAPRLPVTYLCCFCGDAVAPGALWHLTLRGARDGGRQDLFTHAECLRARVPAQLPLLSEFAASASGGG